VLQVFPFKGKEDIFVAGLSVTSGKLRTKGQNAGSSNAASASAPVSAAAATGIIKLVSYVPKLILFDLSFNQSI
jgi:hypothetical protein